MILVLKKFTFLCVLTLVSTFFVNAQVSETKKHKAAPLIKEVSDLTADKVTIKRELVVVDSLMMEMQLEEEDEDFPADDLYGTWNTQYVKAYKGAVVPDSFRVDVSSFYMPFEGKITSKFGPRRRRFHYGTDIKVQVGDTIRAAFDGKVRVQRFERRGYGYFIVLRHSNALETIYGHLSKFLVEPDATVKAGDPIGLGGNTGRSFGSHLHFEMRFLGQAINPEEIVDFANFTTFDETYVFRKDKVSVNNKFQAGSGKSIYYRIKSGDTLGRVAKKYGISIKQLCRLNNIKPTKTLRVGSTLRCS